MTFTNMSRCVKREKNLLQHNDCTFTNFVPRPTEGENTNHKNTSDPWMRNLAFPSAFRITLLYRLTYEIMTYELLFLKGATRKSRYFISF